MNENDHKSSFERLPIALASVLEYSYKNKYK